MRVVIAPDSFKSTMSAAEAARALAEGWAEVRPRDILTLLPMADGGEGTLDTFASLPQARRIPVSTVDALGQPREASWVRLPGDIAVVELAHCCGLTTIDHLAPREAHTFGFGLAIRAALDAGVRKILLAIGGSASNDGGLGLLVALGLRVTRAVDVEAGELSLPEERVSRDNPGLPLSPVEIMRQARVWPLGNAALPQITAVDWTDVVPLPPEGAVILSDVTNPLLGPTGAAAVFGPQKGGASLVDEMDRNLAHWAEVLQAAPGDTADNSSAPGAGAAGGAGFALQRWGATTSSGALTVADTIGFPEAMATADLVITGEGAFDSQSLGGKVVGVVLQLAAAARQGGVPVALIAGRVDTAFDGPAVELRSLMGDAALANPITAAREAARTLATQLST